MPWPSWVLNETNRELQDRIERASAELETKGAEVASYRDVTTLLQKNLLQVRRHIETENRIAAEEQQRLQSDESEFRELQQSVTRYHTELHVLRRRHEELCGLLQNSSRIIQAKTVALEQERAVAEALEQEALSLTDAHASQKNTHAAQQEVERRHRRQEEVQVRLVKAHAALRSSQGVLRREEEEFAQVQQELMSLRLGVERGRKDKTETSQTLLHVQRATEACELQTAANAEAYASGKQAVESQQGLLQQLQKRHEELRLQLQRASRRMEDWMRGRNNLLARLQKVTTEAKQQEEETAALQRQVSAMQDVKQHLVLSSSNAHTLRDERYARMQQLLLRFQELDALMPRARAADDPMQSKHRLEYVRTSLQRGLQHLDESLERLRAATVACLSNLQQEGRVAEGLNHDIARTKAALAIAERDRVVQQESCGVGENHLKSLETQLLVMQQHLQQARDAVRERNQHKQAVMDNIVQELRAQLHRATQGGLELRRDITPLRCILNSNVRALQDAKGRFAALTEASTEQEAELHRLEADAARLAKERQTVELRNSEALLHLGSVRHAAESHLQLVRGTASLQDVMRGQALMVEETLHADLKNATLELHLEQRALAERQIEFRRCQGQLQQLKNRYQSLMESMSRNLAAATGEEPGGGGGGMIAGRVNGVYSACDDLTPEVLHARSILHSSTMHEQLRERGNYLDGRIVFLEHETRTLRKMLDAMRMSGEKSCSTTMGSHRQAAPRKETQTVELLQNDLVGRQDAIQTEVQRIEKLLQALQSRKQDLNKRRSALTKRLCELREVKKNCKSVLRRLKDQVKRTQQKQKKQTLPQ